MRNLPHKEKIIWCLAVFRGTYGFIGSLGSAYARFFDETLLIDVSSSKTELGYILVLCHLGFFIFEWSAQIYFDLKFKTFSKAVQAHHMIAFIGYFNTVYLDEGHFFPLTSFILEMITPFSCIGYILIKSNLSETFVWKANQLILIHLFHMRTMVECTMLYEFYKYWNVLQKLSIVTLFNFSFGLIVVGIFLTPFWTLRNTELYFTKSGWNSSENTKKKN